MSNIDNGGPAFPKDTPMLSMDSPTFAKDFAEAIGLKPGEAVQIATPQFERTDGVQVPTSVDFSDWQNLHAKDEATLKAIGCGIWDRNEKMIHWLFPKEWYQIIPNGLVIVDINGDQDIFVRGETDDDICFGCLAYGFIQNTKQEGAA